MTPSEFATAAVWSYGLAAAGYAAFGVRIALGRRAGSRGGWLLAAMAGTALWAVANIAAVTLPGAGSLFAWGLTDTLRYAAWFAFLVSLARGFAKPAGPAERVGFVPRWVMMIGGAALLASLAGAHLAPLASMLGLESARLEFTARLVLAVFGLILTEQLVRRVSQHARWAIKPLILALAGIFGFDLFFYADATLFGRLDRDIWLARGLANLVVIPLLAIATARNTGWTIDLHLSRQAVFRSTALLLCGVFLLAIASAGYFVRYVGGDWGRALQIEILFVALLGGVLVFSSGRARARLKVFVSKHFFSYRYDYREEWLRFTKALAQGGTSEGVHERTITALANLVESPAGAMWVHDDSRGLVPAARWNMPLTSAVEPAAGSLARFFERTGWVIRIDEYRSNPARYPGLELPDWLSSMSAAWLAIPLLSGTDLLAFVVLAHPRTPIDVEWEVLDLLKTASRQAASYLGQIRATEALLEARKFDAFNRMSAFVVHDLKNLVAQLSLMHKNAERHRANPEFQRDMLSTVENVVERMNKLMLQLRAGTSPVENPHSVDIETMLRRVCAAKSVASMRLELDLAPGTMALGHEDRLEHVFGHLIQNAIDAAGAAGHIVVRLSRVEGYAVVEVIDDGVGMTTEFMTKRLFKPFQTTKTAGMGIGVYESMQYLTGLGGQMQFDSTPGEGTRVRVLIPAVQTAAAGADVRELA